MAGSDTALAKIRKELKSAYADAGLTKLDPDIMSKCTCYEYLFDSIPVETT